MADLFPSLAGRVLPRIGQASAHKGGLKSWFQQGAYIGSFEQISGNVVLGNVAPEELIRFVSYDYERFALASWESFYLASLESETHNLIGWPLLKLYYAGFFAAHAIMRATGEAIINIERFQINTLNDTIRIVEGVSPNLRPGIFQSRIVEIQPGQLSVVLSPPIEGAGVHDGFWKAFAAFLDRIAIDSVASATAEANIFIAGVAELTPKLKGWLSAKRNEINYQHAHGVWFPLTESKLMNKHVQNN